MATERLWLRPPRREDEAAYLALFGRPEVEEWLRPPPLAPFATAEVRQMLVEDVEHWRAAAWQPRRRGRRWSWPARSGSRRWWR